MKIGLLSSSRADFGIYYPLAKKLSEDVLFDLELIVFGTHLSDKFGRTVQEIEKYFHVKYKIETLQDGDSAADISNSIGVTIQKFSKFWDENKFDLVLCLGDRYEMFAAVTAASPFNIKFAHIHAGETTLGAIDNAYRHCISLMSEYLFVTTEEYKNRAIEICQSPTKVFIVGALSIDNLIRSNFYSIEEIKQHFDIDFSKPTILSTFHPETISFEKNTIYIKQLIDAFRQMQENYQILITMPNADTMGLIIRSELENFALNNPKIALRESLGVKGYLSCMKHCEFLLGNTSSGFAEAAYFPKWVINIGDRQKGRIRTPNIIDCEPSKKEILKAVNQIKNLEEPNGCNIYGNGSAASKICTILKNEYDA
ncbi:MAG: UDP-N-acetylglucosamine 2-epimerase [Salinivirgaceae bacterium]|nr:UDP-N-acetylglucosamine 2-epimerase [Salinivirgaceae bacterium]